MTASVPPEGNPDPAREWPRPEVRGAIAPETTSDWSRKRLGAVLVATALAYPFYDYAVTRWLARLEMQAGMEVLRESLQTSAPRTAAEPRFATAEEIAARQARESAQNDALRLQRTAGVRVSGAIDAPVPIAIVEGIPPEGAAEAAEHICRLAAIRLGRELRGTTLRVQRDRGPDPATDAGFVVCE